MRRAIDSRPARYRNEYPTRREEMIIDVVADAIENILTEMKESFPIAVERELIKFQLLSKESPQYGESSGTPFIDNPPYDDV